MCRCQTMARSIDMSKPVERNQPLSICDPVWERLRKEAEEMAAGEPMLASFLYVTLLNHRNFESALSYHLAQKLAHPEMRAMQLRELVAEALEAAPEIEIGRASCRERV